MSVYPLSVEAQRWLVEGEQGLSSKAMFSHLLLGKATDHYHYPNDIDDFQRCERLLRDVPELRPLLGGMGRVSRPWAALVGRWDEIVAAVEAELPGLLEGGWSTCRVPWAERKARRVAADLFDSVLAQGQVCHEPGCGKRGNMALNDVWSCWEHRAR